MKCLTDQFLAGIGLVVVLGLAGCQNETPLAHEETVSPFEVSPQGMPPIEITSPCLVTVENEINAASLSEAERARLLMLLQRAQALLDRSRDGGPDQGSIQLLIAPMFQMVRRALGTGSSLEASLNTAALAILGGTC